MHAITAMHTFTARYASSMYTTYAVAKYNQTQGCCQWGQCPKIMHVYLHYSLDRVYGVPNGGCGFTQYSS